MIFDTIQDQRHQNQHFSRELRDIANFALRGQAIIGGYDISELSNRLEHKTFQNVDDFRRSKPSVDDGKIRIYSYKSNLQGNLSEFECINYKFKLPQAIDDKLYIPKKSKSQDAKRLLELAFEEARKIRPISSQILDKKGYTFTFDSKNMITGASWIPSDITIELKANKNILITSPTLITNKHIPKLGGMYYCKVFTPQNAAKILDSLAFSNTIISESRMPKVHRNYIFDINKNHIPNNKF